ncbi:MAG: cupin domain-containing protein [Pirellulales bacterium]
MAIPHASPSDVIDVRPYGSKLTSAKTTTLFKTERLEVVRVVLESGKEIASHKAPGEIMVHCIEGEIEFAALGKTQRLVVGDLLYLAAEEPHAVKCVENASFLLTILLDR